jgi:ligand-binding sensor domain-containing protein
VLSGKATVIGSEGLVLRKLVLVLLACALATLSDRPAHATDLHNVLTDYVITSWNNKERLPPGVVWALAQDGDGYLWVGNDAGATSRNAFVILNS